MAHEVATYGHQLVEDRIWEVGLPPLQSQNGVKHILKALYEAQDEEAVLVDLFA